MTRLAVIIALLVALASAGFYAGQRWDDYRDERARADTIERLKDAEKSEGDPDADDAWVRDFVDGLFAD